MNIIVNNQNCRKERSGQCWNSWFVAQTRNLWASCRQLSMNRLKQRVHTTETCVCRRGSEHMFVVRTFWNQTIMTTRTYNATNICGTSDWRLSKSRANNSRIKVQVKLFSCWCPSNLCVQSQQWPTILILAGPPWEPFKNTGKLSVHLASSSISVFRLTMQFPTHFTANHTEYNRCEHFCSNSCFEPDHNAWRCSWNFQIHPLRNFHNWGDDSLSNLLCRLATVNTPHCVSYSAIQGNTAQTSNSLSAVNTSATAVILDPMAQSSGKRHIDEKCKHAAYNMAHKDQTKQI